MPGHRSRARKRTQLSQHFLRSRALAASLVTQSTISPDDHVIEIGPGRGALTRELALRCHHLTAVELDERLITPLREEFESRSNVTLVNADFFDLTLPASRYKVFANVPYDRTADIVARLTDAPSSPEEAYLIVQREAAERFAGSPYAAESLRSLLLKPWWQIEITRRLRKSDFDPPPTVESVLLWFARRTRPLVDESERLRYREFIVSCIGRGRTMKHSLRRMVTGRQVLRLARDLRFDLSGPPSSLTFDHWLGLFRYYTLESIPDNRGRGH